MSIRSLSASPIIIIGAGRSGTNMLRDVLTKLEGVDTWPCDEINYIWRHGNHTVDTDEFVAAQASPEVVNFIRSKFESMVKGSSLKNYPVVSRFLVEKTCANSLRVPFVDKVLPEAKFIFLVRDGRDVVSSARKRWKAPLDIPYLAAKARFVPYSDLPFYANQYLLNRLVKICSKERSLAVWGPKFQGMDELSSAKSLDHVCAMQWVKCVMSSKIAFNTMPDEKWLNIQYEEFVKNPVGVLKQISAFMGANYDEASLRTACEGVRTESVGKGKVNFTDESGELMEIMGSTLRNFGYV